ncbi:MAG: IS256 family transposase [Mariprofundus sp.]|nr:IS256 family transposase [Mariprofundus sp.]
MTEYDISLTKDQVEGLLTDDEGLKGLVTSVVNQILEAQMSEHLAAAYYEHNDGRKGYRNGYRPRQLYTRVGKLVLRVPQCRDGKFSTDLFSRYQRSEQALILAMMEMVLQGVSTRRVEKVTEELCGESFSKSMVSRLCMRLQTRVDAWNNRRLDEGNKCFPFLIVDALVIKVRLDDRVVSTSALVVSGINNQGQREILGLKLADSESKESWGDMFIWLKQRGLQGVEFVVSDCHTGLKAAAKQQFQGTTWQRCQVHLMRNVWAKASKKHRPALTAGMRRIFGSPCKQDARAAFRTLAAEMEGLADKALDILETGLEDALAVMSLPEKYRKRLATTNMQERLNEEIRRREKVIRIFPNEESAVRLIGALLAEKHESWLTGQLYFDMDEFHEWQAEKRKEQPQKVRSIM